MRSEKNCKGCSSSVRLNEDDLYKILKNVKKNKQVDFVNETVYKKRLNICRKCKDLLYETTCKFSGCLVYIKANEIDAVCPRPGGSKW